MNLRVSVFFKAVAKALAQAVLIFGLETWAMNLRMCQALGRFQHRVSIQITGRHPCRVFVSIWEYPPLKLAMQEAGFEKVEAYVHSPHKFSSVF